jgi:hypothetical protein
VTIDLMQTELTQMPSHVYMVKAEVLQDSQVKASAIWQFMDQPNLAAAETAARGEQQQFRTKGRM